MDPVLHPELDLLEPGERTLIRRDPDVFPPSKDCRGVPIGLGDASPNE